MNEQMLNQTRDAYSFDRYGEEAWRTAIVNLYAMGYNDEQVEWVLRSKYMRWAADHFASRINCDEEGDCDEVCDGSEIVLYRHKWGIEIEED